MATEIVTQTENVGSIHGLEPFPDRVGVAEPPYILHELDESDVFHTRKVSYAVRPEEVIEDVDCFRQLWSCGVEIVPFNLSEPTAAGENFEIKAIKVTGTTEPSLRKPKVAEAFGELTTSLIRYYYNQYKGCSPFLVDLTKTGVGGQFRGQFVYGTYEGGARTPNFVLVDLDPIVMTANSQDHTSEHEIYRSEYLTVLGDILSRFVEPLELAQGQRHDNYRQLLYAAVKLVPTDNQATEAKVNELLRGLAGEVRPERYRRGLRLARALIRQS